jgi:hypothetical protein
MKPSTPTSLFSASFTNKTTLKKNVRKMIAKNIKSQNNTAAKIKCRNKTSGSGVAKNADGPQENEFASEAELKLTRRTRYAPDWSSTGC